MLVTGGGAIGQLAAMAARALGARRVAVTDPASQARAMAAAEGADAAWDPADPDLAGLADALAPGGFDVAVEASGAHAALGQALALVWRGGGAAHAEALAFALASLMPRAEAEAELRRLAAAARAGGGSLPDLVRAAHSGLVWAGPDPGEAPDLARAFADQARTRRRVRWT